MSPSRRIAPWPCVMRGCNGGAIMTSRRVRGPAAHRAADRAAACKTLSVCYLPSRPMPCRAPRRWRGGAMGTSRPTATGHGRGARCPAANPHERCARNGARARERTTGHERCARNGTVPRGAMFGRRAFWLTPRPRGGRLFFPTHFCMIGQVVSGALRTKPTHIHTKPHPFL